MGRVNISANRRRRSLRSGTGGATGPPPPPAFAPRGVAWSVTSVPTGSRHFATSSLPVGSVAGDVIVCFLMAYSTASASAVMVGTGWTKSGYKAGSASLSMSVFWKVLTGADITAGTVSGEPGVDSVACALYCVSIGGAVSVAYGGDGTTSGASISIPVSPTTVGTMVLAGGAQYNDNDSNLHTVAPLAELARRQLGGSNRPTMTSGWVLQSGSISTASFTATGGIAWAVYQSVVITPV